MVNSAVIAGKEGKLLEEPLPTCCTIQQAQTVFNPTSGSTLHWIAQGVAFVLSLQANI
jgi:hypothetical protein